MASAKRTTATSKNAAVLMTLQLPAAVDLVRRVAAATVAVLRVISSAFQYYIVILRNTTTGYINCVQ